MTALGQKRTFAAQQAMSAMVTAGHSSFDHLIRARE